MAKKVNLNSAVALRNECDQHLAPAFSRLGYKESFMLKDIKLIIGYLCVAFAGLMYYAEKKYKNDFNNGQYVFYTEVLVVLFFGFQFIWYLFGKYVVKTTKYVGIKGAKTLKVSTHLKSKTEPVYYIDVDLDGTIDQEQIELTKVFRETGFIDFKIFSDKLIGIVSKMEKNA